MHCARRGGVERRGWEEEEREEGRKVKRKERSWRGRKGRRVTKDQVDEGLADCPVHSEVKVTFSFSLWFH